MFSPRIFLSTLNGRAVSFLAMAGRSAERYLAQGSRSGKNTREIDRGSFERSYTSSRGSDNRRRDGSESSRSSRNERYDTSRRYYSDDSRHRSDSRRFFERESRPRESGSSGSSRQRRKLEIERMLEIEDHHVRRKDESLEEVVWCPRYIRPDITGHVRGAKALLHHRCRRCRRLCLHLTGRPGTMRLCLRCSGWEEKHVPDWYYHRSCKYCEGQSGDY